MSTLLSQPTKVITDHNGTQLDSQQLLERISKLAFCVTDHNGNFVEVNDAYTELYGYTREELIGNHFSLVLPDEYKQYGTNMHNDFIAGAVEMPAEWTVMNKRGDLIRISAEAIRVEEEDEQPLKLTVIERLD